MPNVTRGKNIIVSAHGNSIRAIVMSLQNYTPEQILRTEIGWCEPWVFHFDNENMTKLEIIPRSGVESKSQLPD